MCFLAFFVDQLNNDRLLFIFRPRWMCAADIIYYSSLVVFINLHSNSIVCVALWLKKVLIIICSLPESLNVLIELLTSNAIIDLWPPGVDRQAMTHCSEGNQVKCRWQLALKPGRESIINLETWSWDGIKWGRFFQSNEGIDAGQIYFFLKAI